MQKNAVIFPVALIIPLMILTQSLFAQESANDAHKQVQITSARLVQQIGEAIEEYMKKHPDTGPPQATTAVDAIKILIEAELLPPHTPTLDGWLNEYFYWSSAETHSYTLKSFGSDRVRSANYQKEIPDGNYWLDIIWVNGKFQQAPPEFMPVDDNEENQEENK